MCRYQGCVIIETRYTLSVLHIFRVLNIVFFTNMLFPAWLRVIRRPELAYRESCVRGSRGGSFCILPLGSSKSFVPLSARTLFIQPVQTAKLMVFEFRTQRLHLANPCTQKNRCKEGVLNHVLIPRDRSAQHRVLRTECEGGSSTSTRR